MTSRRRRITALITAAFALAGAIVLAVMFAAAPVKDFAAVATLVGGVIGAFGLAAGVFSFLATYRRAPEDPAVLLARAVEREWRTESAVRGLERPEPLRVRWASTRRPVTAAPGDAAGDVTAIADAWRALPAPQLVVIGEPGAGKTSAAVLLVRRILATRTEGDPVPVLLNVTDWDPATKHLDAWLAERLHGLYRWLPREEAAGLVERERVIPVLDGLDEMTGPVRTAAAAALTEAVGSDRPFVVTCRSREYEELIGATGMPLARAAVVELTPVDPADVAAYLGAGRVGGDAHWAGVRERLAAEPAGPLATALRTPLMAFLAREEYGRSNADPGELLALGAAGDIEEALLAGYVPAVYRERGPVRPGAKRLPVYAAEDAERWLGFLARHAENGRVAWWRLPSTVEAARSFGGDVLTMIGFGRVAVAPKPWRWRPRFLFGALLRIATPAGLVVGVLGCFMFGRSWLAIPLGLVAAWTFVGSLYLSLSTGGFDEADGAVERHRRDRHAMIGIGAVLGFWTVVLFGNRGPETVVDWIVVPFIWAAPLLGPLVFTASGQLIVTAFVLSRSGLLPISLMRFLDDAHRRGVLRQVGAEYQFRHARLADHLGGTRDDDA
ncbi:hypothetical protein [Phytomonospora endophytica]|uniref:NACHT domain-containing protein n=1 Tax=Phytomonospora endophytica TaxID=714109 RepID=A0A841FYR2_9ACTN|nr:hypothetical protein [Phytomonospora endophytica]MBB6038662.1 hypothetical protein [Phytomonospora endophytica]GIG69194.1 hypothetical protein Pen01_54890 [Phytomonospora endophytica]